MCFHVSFLYFHFISNLVRPVPPLALELLEPARVLLKPFPELRDLLPALLTPLEPVKVDVLARALALLLAPARLAHGARAGRRDLHPQRHARRGARAAAPPAGRGQRAGGGAQLVLCIYIRSKLLMISFFFFFFFFFPLPLSLSHPIHSLITGWNFPQGTRNSLGSMIGTPRDPRSTVTKPSASGTPKWVLRSVSSRASRASYAATAASACCDTRDRDGRARRAAAVARARKLWARRLWFFKYIYITYSKFLQNEKMDKKKKQ
jgi:hypothetical protein